MLLLRGDITMYQVRYYQDKNGNCPIRDYLKKLAAGTDKDSRIKLQKIRDYMAYLCKEGKQAGEPYMKHLDGEIWEIRPLQDRFLFAAWDGNRFILLHHFVKKTQKAPPREIKQAKRNLADYEEKGFRR